MVEAYSEELFEKPTKNSDGAFDFGVVDARLARYYQQGSKITPVRVITPVGTSAQEFKLTDGTDIVQVNSDGSIKTVPDLDLMRLLVKSATFRSYYTSATSATVLYTCPADNVFIVTGMGISGGGSNVKILQIQNSASAVLFYVSSTGATTELPASINGGSCIFKMVAGDKIVGERGVTICGFEIATSLL